MPDAKGRTQNVTGSSRTSNQKKVKAIVSSNFAKERTPKAEASSQFAIVKILYASPATSFVALSNQGNPRYRKLRYLIK